jgi:DNA polymerase-3 subunit alpha
MQTVAGIVADLRLVNGQRGRVAIFKLDDKSAAIEAVASDDLIEAHRDSLKDDELIIVQGKVQPDRFNGGQRLNVTQIWDLAGARAQFGRYFEVTVHGAMPDIADLVERFPPRAVKPPAAPTGANANPGVPVARGLAVRVQLRRKQVCADIDLGEAGLFWPSDEALAAWAATLAGGTVPVVAYEG